MRRVRRISSELPLNSYLYVHWILDFKSILIMCGGGVRSILLFPLVARCLETIDVLSLMFVFMSVVVTVWECVLCSGRCFLALEC